MPRAKSLPPDARKETIIAAALPLLAKHGENFTTRQVAEAAGIAEGTIFRVFYTKKNLIREIIASTVDTTLTCERITQAAQDQPLDAVIVAILAILAEETRKVTALMSTWHALASEYSATSLRAHQHEIHFGTVLDAITLALTPHADDLQVPVRTAAAWVQASALVNAIPLLPTQELTDNHQLATLVLSGLTRNNH